MGDQWRGARKPEEVDIIAIRTDDFPVKTRTNNLLLPTGSSAVGTVGWMARTELAGSGSAGDLVA